MKTNLNHWLVALTLLATLSAPFAIARAQGTAFTYQGRLNNVTNLANGSYDMAFTLFATNVTGTPIAGPVTNPAVAVANGLFTTTVNFTNGFDGGSNWLQLAVSTNGANAFTNLAPRQQLTPVPYAVLAQNVSGTIASTSLAGTYGNALILSNANNVISGNGANVTNVNAVTLGGLGSAGFWQTNGNTGANPTNGAFLGTADNQPLELRVNNQRALRLESVNNEGFAHPMINVIGGYVSNSAAGVDGATIAGGGGSDSGAGLTPNTALTSFAAIGGGFGNTAGSLAGTIAGGYDNSTGPGAATGAAFVGGGAQNNASGDAAVIGGGLNNKASGEVVTIGGGEANSASGTGAFIGGGGYDGSSVGGNTASGNASVVGGGVSNNVSGSYATIPGGAMNSASGNFSFAAGQHAQALHPGAFVWADSLGGAFASTSSNQFLIRAQGGVGIGTTTPGKPLEVSGSASGVPSGGSVDPSVLFRVLNVATDGSESSSDVVGIGFGHNSTREAIVGASYGYDFLDFYVAGVLTSPAMRILGNGNLGLGTTAPANKLDVQGSADFTGKVGIGTTGPAENLTIAGVTGYNSGLRLTGATTTGTGMALENTASGGHKYDLMSSASTLSQGGAGSFQVYDETAGFPRLTLSPGGNLGIGTTLPDRPLTITASSGANGEWLSFQDKFGNTKWHMNNENGGMDFVQTGVADGRLFLSTNGDGYIGMGTTTPTENLTIAGVTNYNNGLKLTGSTTNGTGLAIENTSTGGHKWDLISAGSRGGAGLFQLLDETSGNLCLSVDPIGELAVKSNLFVGAGADVAGVLTVNGADYTTLGYIGFSQANGVGFLSDNLTTPQTNNVSIIAANNIQAAGFWAPSDRRIKDIVDRSDTQKDLETIERLTVTDYRMKDRVGQGSGLHKGFIAQEVQAVIPGGVTQIRNFVPDIYATAANLDYNSAAQTLTVGLAKPHGLKQGDKVRLISETGPVEKEVVAVPDEKTFTVKGIAKEPKQMFVFGRQVDDFLAVDYDRIFTTAVGATQELARRLTEQTSENAELQVRVSNLEARDAQVTAMEKEMGDLKKLVAQLARDGKNTKLAGQSSSRTKTAAIVPKPLFTASAEP